MAEHGSATPRSGPGPKVVHAITRLNIGGPGRHVLAVANGLAPRYDVVVAAGTAPEWEGELDHDAVRVEHVRTTRSIAPWTDAAALAEMRRLLRRHEPAILHSHMAKAGAVARLAARSLPDRPRSVHTFHGHVLSGYFSSRTELAFARIERRLARSTDVLIAVSTEVRDQLLELGIGTASQYEVVPLGVDLAPLLAVCGPSGRLRGHLGLDAGVPLLVVPARLAPVKDHITLLRAIADIPALHVALLGDGELRGQLVEETRQRSLASRVHFVGWWDDMATALADADIVALTSRNEGTPMALIEAAAAARPIVATAVGGVPAVITDRHSGLLTAAGDVAGVARALRELLSYPELAKGLGQQAREDVSETYGMSRSLEHLAAIYDDLLASPVTARRY